MTFFWCKFGFRKCFGASSWSGHWDGHHWLSYKIHLSLQDTIQARNSWLHRIKGDNSSKWWFFFFFFDWQSAHGYPLTEIFHLSNLLQMLNDHRMVHIEFFGNFSGWLLSTSNGQPLCSSSSSLLSSLQNFLDHHCTVHSLAIPRPNAFLMLQIVSAAWWPFWAWIRKLLNFAFWLISFP